MSWRTATSPPIVVEINVSAECGKHLLRRLGRIVRLVGICACARRRGRRYCRHQRRQRQQTGSGGPRTTDQTDHGPRTRNQFGLRNRKIPSYVQTSYVPTWTHESRAVGLPTRSTRRLTGWRSACCPPNSSKCPWSPLRSRSAASTLAVIAESSPPANSLELLPEPWLIVRRRAQLGDALLPRLPELVRMPARARHVARGPGCGPATSTL